MLYHRIQIHYSDYTQFTQFKIIQNYPLWINKLFSLIDLEKLNMPILFVLYNLESIKLLYKSSIEEHT